MFQLASFMRSCAVEPEQLSRVQISEEEETGPISWDLVMYVESKAL
jgi:hypothetical protein